MRVMAANTLPSIGYAIGVSGGGRMSLPVAPANYIYSHFKHVSGVPAPEGVRGVAINKLKVLDVLIEQLSQIKRRPEPAFNDTNPTDERVDAMIQQYENQIRQAQAASAAMPYNPRPAAPLGAVFSLVA
ncbi:hypothetical protein FACS189468_6230 [Spirochaetia bacterium]|nr:hypothetical protein FACS189468_6230 [Spirochaetia bacterium]